jgi:hypothetical protein
VDCDRRVERENHRVGNSLQRFELPKPWPEFADAPSRIGSLEVVMRSYIDRRHVVREPLPTSVPSRAVAVCRDGDGRCTVEHCDIQWNVLASESFDDVDAGVAAVERRYGRRGQPFPKAADEVDPMDSWTRPHPGVVVSRAAIVECTMLYDQEGPEFVFEFVYGPGNRHSQRSGWGCDAYAVGVTTGWSRVMLMDYFIAGRSLEVAYLAAQPETVLSSGPLDVGEKELKSDPIDVPYWLRNTLANLAFYNKDGHRYLCHGPEHVAFRRSEELRRLRELVAIAAPGSLPEALVQAIEDGSAAEETSDRFWRMVWKPEDGVRG